MNAGMEEYLLEERRKNIQREIQQIHLEKKSMRGRVFQPNLFTRSMENLGKWLISSGESLVKRYEAPKKRCQHAAQKSYVH